MKTAFAFALAFAIAGSWLTVVSAECVSPRRKPIKVSGTICGIAGYDILGDPYDRDVQVHPADGPFIPSEAITVTADAKGNFKFGPLAKGSYRLILPGLNTSYPEIVVKKSTKTCGRQLYVVGVIVGDCLTYVTTKKPRRDEAGRVIGRD